jgi:hypothetical protein
MGLGKINSILGEVVDGLCERMDTVSSGIKGEPRSYNLANQKKAVNWLSKLGLKELRRRQSINEKQIKKAYKQKNDNALANLQMMDRLYAAAVDKVAFK